MLQDRAIRLFLGGALLLLAGCGAQVPQVANREVIRVADPATARPVQFQRIVMDIPRGTDIGTISEGINFCSQLRRNIYRGGRESFADSDLTRAFKSELEAANYRVVGDPDALFDDPSQWKAEYLIAGSVRRMQTRICHAYSQWEGITKSNGEVFLEVHWQVYSRLDRKVAYELTTQGRGEVTNLEVEGDVAAFYDAFAQATRNMLGDRGFHDLVTGQSTDAKAGSDAGAPATGSVAAVPTAVAVNRAEFKEPIQSNMSAVLANVVTIRVADGHGSGFFIDRAGHLLTNAHVVEGMSNVKVILASGQLVDGAVIATNVRRDIALVQVAPTGVVGLPVRGDRPQVGSEVYAIGAPVDESLSASVSKGIISAFRLHEGLQLIQSDVTTYGGSSGGPLLDSKGNVVGVTVSGIQVGEAPVGVNFFIPIGDALATLGIGTASGM